MVQDSSVKLGCLPRSFAWKAPLPHRTRLPWPGVEKVEQKWNRARKGSDSFRPSKPTERPMFMGFFEVVAEAGIEPATQGFSVPT
jgi:hypothetical protein